MDAEEVESCVKQSCLANDLVNERLSVFLFIIYYQMKEYDQGFTSGRKMAVYFDKFSKTINIFLSFFEPKWSPQYSLYVCTIFI